MKLYLKGAGGDAEARRVARGCATLYIEVDGGFYRIEVITKERFLLGYERSCRDVLPLSHETTLVLPACDTDSMIKWAIAYREKGYFGIETRSGVIDLDADIVPAASAFHRIVRHGGKVFAHVAAIAPTDVPFLYNDYDDLSTLTEIKDRLAAFGIRTRSLTELREVYRDED